MKEGSWRQWESMKNFSWSGRVSLFSEKMAVVQWGRQSGGRELGDGWEMASGNQMEDDGRWTGETDGFVRFGGGGISRILVDCGHCILNDETASFKRLNLLPPFKNSHEGTSMELEGFHSGTLAA